MVARRSATWFGVAERHTTLLGCGHAASGMNPPPRVWLLTNLPSPYQVELFRAIAAAGEVELEVRFMRAPRTSLDGFSHQVLTSPVPAFVRDEFRLHPHAIWEAARSKHDCYVLSGLYTSVTFLLCAAVLTVRRRPWAMWLERPRPRIDQRAWSPFRLGSGWLDIMRRAVLQLLLRSCHRVICIGSAAVEEYAEQFHVPRSKLLMLPYCCDTERYTNVPRDKVQAVKQRYDLKGKLVFLFSGQMIRRKGVDVLLSAFAQVAESERDIALLLLGDGPLLEELKEAVPQHLKAAVHFASFVEQSDLPAHFAAADVFVFPSRHDGWGVVVNEACAAGLPIIATKTTGAACDLVEDGASGFVIDADAIGQLISAMRFFVEHPEAIPRFGLRSRELVAPFHIDRAATAFSMHVQQTLGCPPIHDEAEAPATDNQAQLRCVSCK